MQDLLNDPETLPFSNRSSINLPILKDEIDRRILKIKTLIQHKPINQAPSAHQFLHKCVQTESTPALAAFNSCHWQESHVLSPSSKFHPNIEPRQSVAAKSSKKDIAGEDKENKIKLRVKRLEIKHRYDQNAETGPESQALIQSNGFTFRGEPSDRHLSTIRKSTLISQGDLEDNSDFLKKSHSDLYDSQIQGRFKGRHTLSPLDFIQNNASQVGRLSMFTDLSNSHRTKTEFSRRLLLLRAKSKYQQQDIIMPEPQRRIIASASCLQRMKAQASTFVPRRRKQFWDTNLRLNLLRRIQEKYRKQIYDH